MAVGGEAVSRKAKNLNYVCETKNFAYNGHHNERPGREGEQMCLEQQEAWLGLAWLLLAAIRFVWPGHGGERYDALACPLAFRSALQCQIMEAFLSGKVPSMRASMHASMRPPGQVILPCARPLRAQSVRTSLSRSA